MKEQAIQSLILKELTDNDILSIKVISCNKRGVSDIICNIQGQFTAIEVKRPYGVMSNYQLSFFEQVIKTNGVSVLINNVQEIKPIIQALINKQNHYRIYRTIDDLKNLTDHKKVVEL